MISPKVISSELSKGAWWAGITLIKYRNTELFHVFLYLTQQVEVLGKCRESEAQVMAKGTDAVAPVLMI